MVISTKGTVYFFTGLSGAGKTTIGGLFHDRLKATKPNLVFLDGDALRPVFCEDSGYTTEDRLMRAGRIFRVCKMLADQGIDVVCCSIAMFDSVRAWNRQNIENYKEIYIKVTANTLLQRNQKGLYTAGHNVVGIDLPFDEPKNPDIIIENDGEKTPLQIVQNLEQLFKENAVAPKIQDTTRDKNYWNNYYKNKMASEEPSPFAVSIKDQLEKGKKMVELGCGNGRDSLYFAKNGIQMLAIDVSDEAITMLNHLSQPNTKFVCDDFVLSAHYQPDKFDYAYSRFTIHAITAAQENILLKNMAMTLKKGGKFFIEVRGVHDELFGKGELKERNAYYYNEHYRRFIVLEELCGSLRANGFLVEYADEQRGFAPYGKEDPMVIRIIAVRQ